MDPAAPGRRRSWCLFIVGNSFSSVNGNCMYSSFIELIHSIKNKEIANVARKISQCQLGVDAEGGDCLEL
jgi:hypothetical protein